MVTKQTIFYKIILPLLLVLLVIRLALPYVLLHYVQQRADKIPDYRVKIADLSLALYRGAYVIKGVEVLKLNERIPVPFFSAERIDLSVQWQALLKGSFVAEMNINNPELNFVIDPKGDNQQLTIDQEWQNVVKALFPLNFNKVTVINGRLSFQSFTSHPPFRLFLKDIKGTLNNFHNADKLDKRLVSTINIHAHGMDGSPVYFTMALDPFAKQPTFDLEAEIKRMQIPEANNFLQHYTKIKVKKGLFSLYIEAAAAQGKISGYAKPIIEHLEVIDTKQDTSPLEALYQGAVQVVSKILENPRKKSVATKIDIKGRIDDPNTSIWSIIGNLLHHAFIQALLPQIDHTVDMRDVTLKN
jgi:hypothetical protein